MTIEKAKNRRVGYQSVALVIVVLTCVIVAGLVLVIVSSTFNLHESEFVTMPNTSLSKSGVDVAFARVSAVTEGSLAVGVKGYLLSGSGSPIVGASVYVQYFFQGSSRTQVATTDQYGFFQADLPMNWTGWLPTTLTYFGDAQHRGLTQVFSIAGNNLAIGRNSDLIFDRQRTLECDFYVA